MLAEVEDRHIATTSKEISLILDETGSYYEGNFNVTGNFLGNIFNS